MTKKNDFVFSQAKVEQNILSFAAIINYGQIKVRAISSTSQLYTLSFPHLMHAPIQVYSDIIICRDKVHHIPLGNSYIVSQYTDNS